MNHDFLAIFSKLPPKTSRQWYYSVALGIINAIIEITLSVIVGMVLSQAMTKNLSKSRLPYIGDISTRQLILILTCLILAKVVFNLMEVRIKSVATSNSIEHYSGRIVENLLDTDTQLKTSASKLQVDVIDNTNNTFRWFFYGAVGVFSDLLSLLFLVVLAFYYEPKLLSLFCLILILVVFPVTFWVNQSQYKLNSELQTASNLIYNLIKQTIEIRNEILLYKKTSKFLILFKKLRANKANLESESLKKSNYPRISIELAFLISICVFAYSQNMSDQKALLDQHFYIFIFCILRIVPIFSRLTGNLTLVKAGSPALKSIAHIFKQDQFVENLNRNSVEISKFDHTIVFENACFKFPDVDTNYLEDISFTINRGDKVAIFGPSGAGKTTLLELLLGLRKISAGTLHIDNQIISNSIKWAPETAYVSQRYDVYDHSLRQAITFDFDNDEINEQKLSEISKVLSFDEATINRIKKVDANIKFVQKLSGGQLQRIAIARALYSESELIVLDEATSNLDSYTAQKLMEYLVTLDKTILLVTHKLPEAKNFSKVLHVLGKKVTVEIR